MNVEHVGPMTLAEFMRRSVPPAERAALTISPSVGLFLTCRLCTAGFGPGTLIIASRDWDEDREAGFIMHAACVWRRSAERSIEAQFLGDIVWPPR